MPAEKPAINRLMLRFILLTLVQCRRQFRPWTRQHARTAIARKQMQQANLVGNIRALIGIAVDESLAGTGHGCGLPSNRGSVALLVMFRLDGGSTTKPGSFRQRLVLRGAVRLAMAGAVWKAGDPPRYAALLRPSSPSFRHSPRGSLGERRSYPVATTA